MADKNDDGVVAQDDAATFSNHSDGDAPQDSGDHVSDGEDVFVEEAEEVPAAKKGLPSWVIPVAFIAIGLAVFGGIKLLKSKPAPQQEVSSFSPPPVVSPIAESAPQQAPVPPVVAAEPPAPVAVAAAPVPSAPAPVAQGPAAFAQAVAAPEPAKVACKDTEQLEAKIAQLESRLNSAKKREAAPQRVAKKADRKPPVVVAESAMRVKSRAATATSTVHDAPTVAAAAEVQQAPTVDPLAGYRVHLVVPHQAWISTPRGQTEVVHVGDKVAGIPVTKIDADGYRVVLGDKVIR